MKFFVYIFNQQHKTNQQNLKSLDWDLDMEKLKAT